MQSVVTIVLRQMFTMFFLLMIGIFLYRKHYLDEHGTQQISNILLQICTPAIIINSFNIPFTWVRVQEFSLTFGLTLAALILAALIAVIAFHKDERIERFATIFSNASFMGIPLVSSLLGEESVFYLTSFLLCFNIVSWTYGVVLISGRRDLIRLTNLIRNPAIVGAFVGALVFVSPLKLPALVSEPIVLITRINTALAMIVLGVYVAKSNFKVILGHFMSYKVSIFRLVVVPVAVILMLMLVPNDYMTIKKVTVIALSAPIGVLTALFAQLYGGNYEYGAGIVSLSTCFSIITMPLMLSLAEALWRL